MNKESTKKPRKYDLLRYQETHEIAPPGTTIDSLRIMKYIYKFLFYLSQIGIIQEYVKNFVVILRKHSQKPMKNISNSRQLNRYDFAALFNYLFDKIKRPDLFKEREIQCIHDHERNIIFTYFAAFYPSILLEIAENNFNDLYFSSRLYQKEVISEKFIKLINEIENLKKAQIQENVDFNYFTNDQPIEGIDFEQDSFDNMEFSQNEELFCFEGFSDMFPNPE